MELRLNDHLARCVYVALLIANLYMRQPLGESAALIKLWFDNYLTFLIDISIFAVLDDEKQSAFILSAARKSKDSKANSGSDKESRG